MSILSEWVPIRGLGNSAIVKATVFVPAIGYLIILNRELAEWAILDPRFGVPPEAYPWRLALLYYGLATISAGSLMYTLRCPDLVKRFESASDYVRSEVDFLKAYDEAYQERIRLSETPLKSPDGPGEWRELFPPEPSPPMSQHSMNVMLRKDWNIANSSRPLSRILCFSLFAGGMATLAIPTSDTFLRVTASLFRALNFFL